MNIVTKKVAILQLHSSGYEAKAIALPLSRLESFLDEAVFLSVGKYASNVRERYELNDDELVTIELVDEDIITSLKVKQRMIGDPDATN